MLTAERSGALLRDFALHPGLPCHEPGEVADREREVELEDVNELCNEEVPM